MVLSFLFKKLRNLVPARADLHLVMYTRTGCHLCETAWKELTAAQSLYRFRLDEQDVDADPELAVKYGACVPVVTVNGKVRFRGTVNPVLLRRILVGHV